MKEMLRNQLQNNQFKMSQKFKMAHKRTSGETWPSMKSESFKTSFSEGQVFNLKYFDFIPHLPQLEQQTSKES